ncbi:hypothetical protein V495_00185 [Pseudogymnoascus sp. VKM F-4514 (FW-929)]|nr:hypothetical protein V495_00185 [Pseudogymnoascus sp. VKM F-4514 (FW-929)]KFY67303.1 hypothetical protein V497_00416 [Pseudogymnoascus sp. VKM F-4516 (FW-969)]
MLSSSNAIWTLTSIMLPNATMSDLHNDSNPLIEALFNFQLLHIRAYIVYVDMVLNNEVTFKLTPDSIEALVNYHKEIHCVNILASTLEKKLQVKELHEEFNQAINNFVYQTNVTALEGLEKEGAGELLCDQSEEVKNNIMSLLHAHRQQHQTYQPLPPYATAQECDGEATAAAVAEEASTSAGVNELMRATDNCTYPECTSAFSQVGHRNEHLRRHTSKRPLVCLTCDKAFHSRSTMRKHMRDVHDVPSLPLEFVCQLDGCGRCFNVLGNLKRHMDLLHTETLRRWTIRFSELGEKGVEGEEERQMLEYFRSLYRKGRKITSSSLSSSAVCTSSASSAGPPTLPTSFLLSSSFREDALASPVPIFISSLCQQIDLPLHDSISIGDPPLLYHGFKSVAVQDDMIYELNVPLPIPNGSLGFLQDQHFMSLDQIPFETFYSSYDKYPCTPPVQAISDPSVSSYRSTCSHSEVAPVQEPV